MSENDLLGLRTVESLYLMEMGVDTRLMTMMMEVGPNVMRRIRPDEARTLRVTTDDLPPNARPALNGVKTAGRNNRV